jgi:hypothetical protein
VVSTLVVVLKNISKTMASTGERKSRKNYPLKGEFGKMRIKPGDITVISEKCSLNGKLKMLGNVMILGSFTGRINSRTLARMFHELVS